MLFRSVASPGFLKNFNEIVDKEISLGNKGFMRQLGDGVYANTNKEGKLSQIVEKDAQGNWNLRDATDAEQTSYYEKYPFKVEVTGTGGTTVNTNPGFFEKYGSLFSFGTNDPLATKLSLFGSGASGGTDNNAFKL